MAYCLHDGECSVVRKRNSRGKPMYKMMCHTCGYAGGNALSHRYVRLNYSISKIPAFDENKSNMLWAVYKKKRNDDWKEKYPAYLQTQEWKIKREEVFRRDNYLCQFCHHYSATQVHHLSYDNIFNEPLEDLVAICRTCHDKHHNKKE